MDKLGEKIVLSIKENNGMKFISFIMINSDGQIYMDKTVDEAKTLLAQWTQKVKDLKEGNLVFEINPFLMLKFEHNATNIYVDGKRFNQCKYLLINIPTDKIGEYDEIKSIDDAERHNLVGTDLHGGNRKIKTEFSLSPEQEFQGHCSNLQAWYENDYDTIILHRNLAFPLLKKLAEVGDPVAKRKFKDEIAIRLESGEPNVFEYLVQGGYLDIFEPEELNIIANNNENPIIEILLLSRNQENKFSQFTYNVKTNGFQHKRDKMSIVSYDSTIFKEAPYMVQQNIYKPLKMTTAAGGKFLDFKLNNIDKKVLYSLQLIKLAKDLLDKSPDIEISIPEWDGLLKISSKEKELKIFIFPDYLMR